MQLLIVGLVPCGPMAAQEPRWRQTADRCCRMMLPWGESAKLNSETGEKGRKGKKDGCAQITVAKNTKNIRVKAKRGSIQPSVHTVAWNFMLVIPRKEFTGCLWTWDFDRTGASLSRPCHSGGLTSLVSGSGDEMARGKVIRWDNEQVQKMTERK